MTASFARAAAALGMALLVTLSAAPAPTLAQPAVGDDDGRVRVFTVAWHHTVERVESYETFRDAVRAQFEADVVPHLAEDRPNLIAYPEDIGLMAYFVGTRGAGARTLLEQGAGAVEAMASLAGPYAPQIAYYEARFPGVDSPGQLLLLALTDVSGRVVVETFSELAAEHGVYVTTSTNVAELERIDGPQAALLADPDDDTSYAYEAVGPDVYNTNFVFGPDGALLDAQRKAYLVPIERERELGLGMTGVEVDELGLIELPFARLGTVTSKDAWMVDVNDRYDQLRAALLIQPEAFDTWGDPGEDLWPPDKLQRSGWLATQRHPGLIANSTPMLTGNFGDLRFDGQPLVTVEGWDPATGDTNAAADCLMGQEPEPGWASVGRWSDLDDPAPALCGEDQRHDLADRAERMAPGSGDDLENAYAEDVIWTDLDLSLDRPSAPRLPRHAGAPGSHDAAAGGDGATQLVPALHGDAEGALLAWVDFRRGTNQSVFTATTGDGEAWDDPVLVSDKPVATHDHFDNQWAPAVTRHDDDAVAMFLDFRTENWDVYRSTSADGGTTWSDNLRVDDAEDDEGTLRERGHSAPVIVRAADDEDAALVAAWSDLRWPFVHPQVRVARSEDGGVSWSPTVRVDGGTVDAGEVDVLDGRSGAEAAGPQSAPAIAVTGDGDVVVAWQDTSGGLPHVRVARSTDGGESFGASARVSGTDHAAFRPSLDAAGSSVWLAWEERAGTARAGTVVRVARSSDGGRTFGPPVTADQEAPAGVTQWHATVVADTGDRAAVVFTDDRAGQEDIVAVPLRAGDTNPVAVAGPQRVSDNPDGTDARAPAAALLGAADDARLLVVWQDTRDGTDRLRATSVTAALDGVAPEEPAGVPADPDGVPHLPATGGGIAIALLALGVGALLRHRRDPPLRSTPDGRHAAHDGSRAAVPAVGEPPQAG